MSHLEWERNSEHVTAQKRNCFVNNAYYYQIILITVSNDTFSIPSELSVWMSGTVVSFRPRYISDEVRKRAREMEESEEVRSYLVACWRVAPAERVDEVSKHLV